nr:ribonuclease H-like domain-containing protein [Tanacetum cinerariifolium]
MEKDGLGAQEDASKQRRMIEEIDQNAKIALDDETQGKTNDDEMFGVNYHAGEEVVMETTTGVKDSGAPTTDVIEDEVIMAQALAALKKINGEVISHEDANMKLLRSLSQAWNNISLIMRNKPDIETLSMDDLYNNLKVYEAEIKGQSTSGSNSHNVAFVSFKNTSSINKTVNAAHDIPAASLKKQPFASSYADDVKT